MILRGLLVAAAGFVFIFSPALPIGLLRVRVPGLERGLIFWGMALWPAALLPALFLQSLLRQAAHGAGAPPSLAGRPADYAITLAGALVTALIVQAAMLLVLRRQRPGPAASLPAGLSLGFGLGLVAQVFTGLSLVSAGFRLTLGAVEDPLLAALAGAEAWALALSLLPLILFRPALLVVCAVRGVLVARALGGRARLWWAAVGLDVLFAWAVIALHLALGAETPGQISAGSAPPLAAGLSAVYYLAAFALAYWWIAGQLGAGQAASAAPASGSLRKTYG